MNVVIAGDWHGNGKWALRCIEKAARLGVREIWHLGDFGLWPGEEGSRYMKDLSQACKWFGIRILVTPGNHEDYSRIDNLKGSIQTMTGTAGRDGEIAFLPRGYVWEVDDRKICSFGGAPSIDAEYRVEGTSWWREEMPSRGDLERLDEIGKVDVLLSHETSNHMMSQPVLEIISANPMGWSPKALAYARQGRMFMDQVVESVEPELNFHGHYHVAGEGRGVVSLGGDGGEGNLVLFDPKTMKYEWVD